MEHTDIIGKITDKPSLTLTRHYPVAPEKVWRAWTDPQALKQWWGPGGNDRVSVAEIDLRAGGRHRLRIPARVFL